MAFNPQNLVRWAPSTLDDANTLFDSPLPIAPPVQLPQHWAYNAGNDTVSNVEASGYFFYFANYTAGPLYNNGNTFQLGDVIYCVCSNGTVNLSITGLNPITTAAFAVAPGSITGADLSNPLVTTAGVTTDFSTASATPGTIRAWTGAAHQTAVTMTSGDVVGVRGEVDMVSASGGFAYGVQGKVIPTGTLSGSVWAPAVFGQYDLTSATINGGQIAAVWGDMGANAGVFTNVTGARMFAGTNTVPGLTLFAMDYRYGQATNLLELDGSSSTYITAGGAGAPGGTVKKIAISIDGATYYLVASSSVS